MKLIGTLTRRGLSTANFSSDGYDPHWGCVGIRDVRTVAVERWLKQLCRVDGERLADATKAKIRNLMSVLFNHAIRYEWLEQGRNPITLVRQSAQRRETYWEYMRIDRLTVTSMEVS